MQKQVYTIQEVAALIRFSAQTVREWVRDGKVMGIRIGGRAYRIPRSEVERLLRELHIDLRVMDDESPGATKGATLGKSRRPAESLV